MNKLIFLNIFRLCILGLVEDADHPADQINALLIIEMYGPVLRVQGVQSIFFKDLDISFISYYKGTDLAVAEVRPIWNSLNKDILPAAEIRLHTVSVHRKDTISASDFRGGIDIHSLAFIVKLGRITDTSG